MGLNHFSSGSLYNGSLLVTSEFKCFIVGELLFSRLVFNLSFKLFFGLLKSDDFFVILIELL